MRGIRSIFGAALLAICAGPAGAGHLQSPGSDAIYQSCTERGGEAEACTCVSREVRSRFDEREREILILSFGQPEQSSEERARALQDSGLGTAELSALTRRMVNAEMVIRQACGAGLMRVNPRG